MELSEDIKLTKKNDQQYFTENELLKSQISNIHSNIEFLLTNDNNEHILNECLSYENLNKNDSINKIFNSQNPSENNFKKLKKNVKINEEFKKKSSYDIFKGKNENEKNCLKEKSKSENFNPKNCKEENLKKTSFSNKSSKDKLFNDQNSIISNEKKEESSFSSNKKKSLIEIRKDSNKFNRHFSENNFKDENEDVMEIINKKLSLIDEKYKKESLFEIEQIKEEKIKAIEKILSEGSLCSEEIIQKNIWDMFEIVKHQI